MKIAIVGFGISGAALLMALKTSGKLDTNITVDIFDPSDELAVGLAYAEDDTHLLVNAFPTAMSLNIEDKFDFSKWLEIHYPKYESKVDLVPRPIYGEYAKERLQPLLEADNVTHHRREIIDVFHEKANHTYTLEDTEATEYTQYDYLFLAVGMPSYNDFYQLRGQENYIHNPYPVNKILQDIASDDKVTIIGSSLTAFDLVNYLSHEKDLSQPIGIFTNTPYFNSLRVAPYQGNDIIYSLDKDWIQAELAKNKGFIPLDQIIETIASDLQANQIDLESIRTTYDPAGLEETYLTFADKDHPELSKLQAYIGRIAGYLGDLYTAMNKQDLARFHRDYATLFNHYQVRLAPDAVENMYRLKTQDKLFIVPDLIDINKDENFVMTSSQGQTYEADIVINATGFDFNTDHIGDDNGLLSRLLDKGFLLDKDKRGLLVTWPENQVINQLDGQLNTCFYIGPWLANTHYGNNNVKALIEKANEIVRNYVTF